jgi:hypothetical protein
VVIVEHREEYHGVCVTGKHSERVLIECDDCVLWLLSAGDGIVSMMESDESWTFSEKEYVK